MKSSSTNETFILPPLKAQRQSNNKGAKMLQESEVWDNHSETVSSGYERTTAPISSAAVFAFTWPTHQASHHHSSFAMRACKSQALTEELFTVEAFQGRE